MKTRHGVAWAVAALMSWGSQAQAFEIASPDFKDGASVPEAQLYTACGGADRSPALQWRDAPQGTKSFAITLFDPDARGGWWHWIVTDIPADVQGLAEGAGSGLLPKGAQMARNDFGNARYDGPCPPQGSGPHHYVLTIFALPMAALPAAGDGAALTTFLDAHALARTSITGIYERP